MTNLLITRGSMLAPLAIFAFIGGFGTKGVPHAAQRIGSSDVLANDVVANDNRTPAGSLKDGILTLHLEVRPRSNHHGALGLHPGPGRELGEGARARRRQSGLRGRRHRRDTRAPQGLVSRLQAEWPGAVLANGAGGDAECL
ncbi:MAG: hypothetical protein ABI875_03380, partial [Gemmatimonadales bacterium]